MTYAAAPGGSSPITFPGEYGNRYGAAPGLVPTGTISASANRYAFIVRCPKTGTLRSFEWMCQNYTGTNTVRHSFQTIDTTTGFPNGTVSQFRTFNPTAGAWAQPGIISSDGTDNGTKRAVNRNDWLGCVIDFSAYTSGLFTTNGISDTTGNEFTYYGTFAPSTWTRNTANCPSFALLYDDGTYASMYDCWLWPITTVTTTNINTGTSPNEFAVKFQVPWGCKAWGARIMMLMGADVNIKLYDGSNNVLATSVMNHNMVPDIVDGGIHLCQFDSEVTLAKNTTYRMSILPQTGTNTSCYDVSAQSGTQMSAMPGGGNWILSTRTGNGAWSDSGNRVPWFWSLQLSAIDDGTGASGFSGAPFERIHLGM